MSVIRSIMYPSCGFTHLSFRYAARLHWFFSFCRSFYLTACVSSVSLWCFLRSFFPPAVFDCHLPLVSQVFLCGFSLYRSFCQLSLVITYFSCLQCFSFSFSLYRSLQQLSLVVAFCLCQVFLQHHLPLCLSAFIGVFGFLLRFLLFATSSFMTYFSFVSFFR